MKRLGVLGGLGPESTIVYYRSILAAGSRRLGGTSPPVHINSIDVRTVLRLVEENALTALTDYLVEEIDVLARAGASLAIIAANTPHIVFNDIRQRSPIDLVNIVEATRDAARSRGLKRLALLGTKFTMDARFYPDLFSKADIELVRPQESEKAFIHQKYVGELLKNVLLPETRARILEIIGALKDRDGVDGVILAGTELPLLLTSDDASGIPLLDTTHIHVMATVNRLWP